MFEVEAMTMARTVARWPASPSTRIVSAAFGSVLTVG